MFFQSAMYTLAGEHESSMTIPFTPRGPKCFLYKSYTVDTCTWLIDRPSSKRQLCHMQGGKVVLHACCPCVFPHTMASHDGLNCWLPRSSVEERMLRKVEPSQPGMKAGPQRASQRKTHWPRGTLRGLWLVIM